MEGLPLSNIIPGPCGGLGGKACPWVSSSMGCVHTRGFLVCWQLGKVYGVESHVLSPAQTKELYPLMNVDDLYGTLYVPKDGTMDPAGTCSTLARAAAARGATVMPNY